MFLPLLSLFWVTDATVIEVENTGTMQKQKNISRMDSFCIHGTKERLDWISLHHRT